METRVPKTISSKARDKLIADLFERGISYEVLPDFLFHYHMRDILDWLKTHYGLTYCYRCQRLTHPEEMTGRTNMCDKHTNRNSNSPEHRFIPNRDMVAKLRSKVESGQQKEITERFEAKQLSEPNVADRVMQKLRKEQEDV